MKDDNDELLEQWARRLIAGLEAEGFGTGGLAPDIGAVLGLAGRAAHAVVRPAAPLTTFLVGYAAGLAAARGEPDAVASVASTAARIIQEYAVPE